MAKLRREMLAVNSFRERLYDNPIGHIWMTTDGGGFGSRGLQAATRRQGVPPNAHCW